MVGIDKTWCQSIAEFNEFKQWAKENKFITPFGEIIDFRYCMYSFDNTPEELMEELTNCKSILVMNTSIVEDYYLIKYCNIPFVQSRMKRVYSAEVYESIKNGTSEFDTFNRDSIAGTRVKCIRESKFGKKDFLYKRKGKRFRFTIDHWIDVDNEWLWMSYNEQFNYWVICGKELMNNDTNVCHKPIKTRKAMIRQIRKWKLPKGTVVHWKGIYQGDEMLFKVY